MPNVDILIKGLMQKRPEDFIAYLLPEYEDPLFDVIKPEEVTTQEFRVSALWRIRDGDDFSIYI